MNKSVVYAIGVSLVVACVYLIISLISLQKEVNILKAQQTTNTYETEEKEVEIELAVYMNRLQLYADKLWFAAKSQNWDMASFYLEETKETMEELTKHSITEDGIRIDEQMKTWGIPAIEPLQKSIEQKTLASFEIEYSNLIANCNGCHTATKHNFIKIKTPDSPAFTNQVY